MASQSGQQTSAGAVGDGRIHGANEGMEYHPATGEDRAAGALHGLVASIRNMWMVVAVCEQCVWVGVQSRSHTVRARGVGWQLAHLQRYQ